MSFFKIIYNNLFHKGRNHKFTLNAPGPSPWFFRKQSPIILDNNDTLHWETKKNLPSGITCLKNSENSIFLLLDFGWYCLTLTNNRILLWKEEVNKSSTISERYIAFYIISLNNLMALENPVKEIDFMRKNNISIKFNGKSISCNFKTYLEAGTYPINFPIEFQELTELLVLADYGPLTAVSNHFDKMYRAIFSFDFNVNNVTVYPQNWFNNGSYDYGYQWITRVQRDNNTGLIIGEGIRLGNFLLDSTSTNIKKWLKSDSFFHPEQE